MRNAGRKSEQSSSSENRESCQEIGEMSDRIPELGTKCWNVLVEIERRGYRDPTPRHELSADEKIVYEKI